MNELPRARSSPAEAPNEPPIRELVTDLWENTETLVRQELELALAHLDVRVRRVKNDLTAAAIGGSVLYAGVLALVAAAILLLAKVVAPWVSALIVGGIVTGVGFVLLQKGAAAARRELAPQETLKSKHQQHFFEEATK
jgi:hypothetical protein